MNSKRVSDPAWDAQQALLAAATLQTGRSLDCWSLAVLLTGLLAVMWLPPSWRAETPLLWLSLLTGAIQKYLAMRTALDAEVFAAWSQSWGMNAGSDAERDLVAFDQALQSHFGKSFVPRSLETRIAGALILFRRQGLALGAQLLWLSLALAGRCL